MTLSERPGFLNKVIISTDGSGTTKGPGGWAAVIRFGDHCIEVSGGEPEATNNRMELTAVYKALERLKRSCEVELTTDSEYVQKGITERLKNWQRFGWRTYDGAEVKNRDIWELIAKQLERHEVTVVWTRGHKDHADNNRADELAGQERKKLLGEEPKVKSKRKPSLKWLGDIDIEALKEALAERSEEEREKLRRLLLPSLECLCEYDETPNGPGFCLRGCGGRSEAA